VRNLFFVAFFIASAFANPLWYLNTQKTKTNSYVGYGSGVDEVHAKQEALNDIASQISVSVNTSLKQNQKLQNGKFQNIEEFSSLQNSKAVLSDYELLKSEFYKGRYFVCVEYENIPSLDKFVRKVKVLGTTEVVHPNLYLKDTLIAEKLKKVLKKDIEFKLLRKDKKWFIKYKSVMQVLDKKDFAKFYVTVPHAKLSIRTDKKRDILYDGDKFYFKVKSAKKGYVTIFSVYEDGTVVTLVRNISIGQNRVENIPDKDFETIPEAGLIEKGKETFDLYVAIYSQKKMRFDSFAYADEKLISEEKYKNFDELIEFLDSKTYTTLKVVTKPRLY